MFISLKRLNFFRFLKNNDSCLQKDFVVEFYCGKSSNVDILDEQPSTSKRGRPIKSFDACEESAKRYKVRDLLESRSDSELCYAAQMSKRASGFRAVANIIQSVSENPENALMLKNIEKGNLQRMYTGEEALALYIDAKLSQSSYLILRKQALAAGHSLYPSKYVLRKAKQECFPPESSIYVDETCAYLNVQDIVHLTTIRLLKAQESVLTTTKLDSLTLICKWGGDGSSNHSNYKQKFKAEGCSDSSLFVLSFVPIQLRATDNPTNVLWQNPSPSSTRLCRPLKFLFAKETEEMSVQEFEVIRNQIENLQNLDCFVCSQKVTVKFEFVLTMIDGKMANYLTSHKSTQSCYICGAKPSEMNNVNIVKEPNSAFYSYGLSSLHAWIKTLECMLHIAYRLELKKYMIRQPTDKESVANRKKDIQMRFKNEMGLIIDGVKPGYGTTNDGNTARRFFMNYSKSAQITGLEEEVIKSFYIILSVLSSGFEINLHAFQGFLQETRDKYLKFYDWYPMPVSVHKILCHAIEVIKNCIVPIGQLSEEAQEARNKDCRRYRLAHTRKSSRINTNRDLLNMLLITSDPLINSYRQKPFKNFSSLPPEVISFLVEPSFDAHKDLRFELAEASETEETENFSESDSDE